MSGTSRSFFSFLYSIMAAGVEFLSHWAEIGEMIADFSCKGKLSIGPQKFFKIQWIQSQDIKVVDGERIRINHTFIDRGNVKYLHCVCAAGT